MTGLTYLMDPLQRTLDKKLRGTYGLPSGVTAVPAQVSLDVYIERLYRLKKFWGV